MMKTYIYILQDPITLDVRYVGKSNNPVRRFQSHLWVKPRVAYYSYFWIQKLLKSGLKPIMTIIDETESDWQSLEQYWISQFKTWGFNLTNQTIGGEGTYGLAQWNNVPVSAYDKLGVFIKSFKSQKICAEYFNTSASNVRSVVSGRNKLLLKKYQIRLGDNYENIGSPSPRKKRIDSGNIRRINMKKIMCIEDDLNFDSVSEAAIYYNLLITTISNILNGRTKKSKNNKSFRYI